MQHKDWSIKAEKDDVHGTCVHVIINKDVSIEGLMFELLDEERKLITSMKIVDREIYLCTSIGRPEFARIGDSVKYVEGSGKELYGKLSVEK